MFSKRSQDSTKPSQNVKSKLWCDDERPPPDDSWEWAKSAKEAQTLLTSNKIKELSLDFDLNHKGDIYDHEAATGADVAAWAKRHNLLPPTVIIHSANPDGIEDIKSALGKHPYVCAPLEPNEDKSMDHESSYKDILESLWHKEAQWELGGEPSNQPENTQKLYCKNCTNSFEGQNQCPYCASTDIAPNRRRADELYYRYLNRRKASKNPWKLSQIDFQDLYHIAPTEERARIQSHGLQPSNVLNSPYMQNNPYIEFYKNQPTGVYGWTSPEAAKSYLSGTTGTFSEPMDIWRIPANQIRETLPDTIHENAQVIPHVVYPELYRPYESGPTGNPDFYDPSSPLKNPIWTPKFEIQPEWRIGEPTFSKWHLSNEENSQTDFHYHLWTGVINRLAPDKAWTGGYYYPDIIPPEALELHKPIEEEGWNMYAPSDPEPLPYTLENNMNDYLRNKDKWQIGQPTYTKTKKSMAFSKIYNWKEDTKLSHEAPVPPNYRKGTKAKHCSICTMYDKGLCWGYGNVKVEDNHVCDSFELEAGKKSKSAWRMATESKPNKEDKQATPVHLIDTVLHNLEHTRRHLERFKDKDVQKDPKAIQFNYEHAIHHLEESISHAEKVVNHLRDTDVDADKFKEESKELSAIKNVDKNKKKSGWYLSQLGLLPGMYDPLRCPSCGGLMSEPHQEGHDWFNNCSNCGLSRKVPPNHPLLLEWQENFPAYPQELQEVSDRNSPWAVTYPS